MKLTEQQLKIVYAWADTFPFSKQKRRIDLDFSDGVLIAEIIKTFHPKLVQLHNYPSANSTRLKLKNWEFLKAKVFRKLGLKISKNEIQQIVKLKKFAIENFLWKLYNFLNSYEKSKAEKQKLRNKQNLVNKKKAKQKLKRLQFNEEIIRNDEKSILIMELSELKAILEKKVKSLKAKVEGRRRKIDQLRLQLKEAEPAV